LYRSAGKISSILQFANPSLPHNPSFPPSFPASFASAALPCTNFSTLPFIEAFQWFLTLLSVLPGSNFAITAHLGPISCITSRITLSSSSVHAALLIRGSKWLCQRSRHCLSILPGNIAATTDHFLGPFASTNSLSTRSSSTVHPPFFKLGFNTVFHRRKQSNSFRPGKAAATSAQLLHLVSCTK